MELNQTSYATAMLPFLVAPDLGHAGEKSACFGVVLGAAAEQSARFRVDGHAQVTSPITGAYAGPVMGHRTWSPPIT